MQVGYKEFKLNSVLAEKLLDYPPEDRKANVLDEINNIFSEFSSIYVTNFEMLFDPHYEIDVVKLFCEIARKTKIAVKWPGNYVDSKLTYANQGAQDYHEFDCKAYQILIVQ